MYYFILFNYYIFNNLIFTFKNLVTMTIYSDVISSLLGFMSYFNENNISFSLKILLLMFSRREVDFFSTETFSNCFPNFLLCVSEEFERKYFLMIFNLFLFTENVLHFVSFLFLLFIIFLFY